MHALLLAAALFTPGSAEDPAVLIESCRAATDARPEGQLCLSYLAGFGAGLNLGADSTYKRGNAGICFNDKGDVSTLDVARQVVEMADGGAFSDVPLEVSSAAVALAALHFTLPCE